MALARGRLMSLDSYYESLRGNGGSAAAEAMEVDSSSVGYFGLITQNKAMEGEEVRDVDHHHNHHPVAAESVLNYPLVNNPPSAVSDPSSSSSGSGGFVFGMMNSPSPVTIDSTGVGVGVGVAVGDHHSNILNFKTGAGGGSGGATGCNYQSYLNSSMLSFDRHRQIEDFPVQFSDGLDQLDHFNFKYGGDDHSSMRVTNDQNFLETSSGNINGSTSVAGMTKDNGRIGSDEQFGWIYASDTADGDGHQKNELLDVDVRKRPHQMVIYIVIVIDLLLIKLISIFILMINYNERRRRLEEEMVKFQIRNIVLEEL